MYCKVSVIIMSLVTGLFFLVILLNQQWPPTAQASSFTLQYFPYYVWCSKYSCLFSESIECFPGTASKFFLKLLVTIPVALIITGIIVHFRFHIRCISIHKLLYFNFFFASFCTTFLSAGLLLLLLLLLLLPDQQIFPCSPLGRPFDTLWTDDICCSTRSSCGITSFQCCHKDLCSEVNYSDCIKSRNKIPLRQLVAPIRYK